MQMAMVVAALGGVVVNVPLPSMYAKFLHKVESVLQTSKLSGARKQDGLNLSSRRSQSQPSRQSKGGAKRIFSYQSDNPRWRFVVRKGLRILALNGDVDEAYAVTELETWQLRKLAAAAELGPQCVNVDALAAEVGLSKNEVLAWSGTATEDHLVHDGELGSYMEDVNIIEEVEKPAKHVPARPVSEQGSDMQCKIEDLMYTLKDVLPGRLADIFADKEKWKSMAKHFSENMDFQNPLFCMRGRNRFLKWVQILGKAGVFLSLHDIYYENIFANKSKRWVIVVWTICSTNEESTSGLHSVPLSRLQDSPESNAFKNAFDRSDSNRKDGNISGSAHGDDVNQKFVTTPEMKSSFEMSGETSFEMDHAGLGPGIPVNRLKLISKLMNDPCARIWERNTVNVKKLF